MQSWVENIPRDVEGGRHLYKPSTFQFGDWLDPDAPPDNPAAGKTNAQLVANPFLAHSLDMIAQIAAILGRSAEAGAYAGDAATVREEFCGEYVTPDGRLASDTQTAYTLAICFKMFSRSEHCLKAGERLALLVRQNGFRIATGFAGTPFVCEALALTGHVQVAYRMLLEEKCPSWLYPLTMGATTMWERWNSMLPDDSINPGEMTSFNQYSCGAVVTFLQERLGGLRCTGPGWKTSRAEPMIGGGFTEARVKHVSPYGETSFSWKLLGDTLELRALVPSGMTMDIALPPGDGERVKIRSSGEHLFHTAYTGLEGWPPAAI